MSKIILVLFVFLAALLFGFLAWYFSHKAKHKERLLLIEKGITPEEFLKEPNKSTFPWLKWGIVLLGMSVGLGIISIIAETGVVSMNGSAPLAILGLCTGISMIVANYTGKNKAGN